MIQRGAGAADPAVGTAAGSVLVRDRTTWLCYALIGYFAFLQTVLGPLMPFLRAELGLGYGAAGLHFSAFALGPVLVGLAGDGPARRWGRRASLWGGRSAWPAALSWSGSARARSARSRAPS